MEDACLTYISTFNKGADLFLFVYLSLFARCVSLLLCNFFLCHLVISLSQIRSILVLKFQNLSTVDPGHPRRGSEGLRVLIDDLGAPSGARIHHHHQPKGGSTAQLLMREAHEREAAHPRGIVHRATGQNTAGALRRGAGAPWRMMVEERAH